MSGLSSDIRGRRRRILLLALGIMIAGLVAGNLLLSGRGLTGEANELEQDLPPFYEGNADSVVAITVQHTGLALQRQSILQTDARFEWSFPAVPDAQLREPQVLELVEAAIGLRPLRVISEAPTDLSVYGLKVPRGRIEMVLATGDRLIVLLGAVTATGNSYAMLDGQKTVYTVSGDVAYLLSRKPEALIDTTLPTFEPVLVRRLRVLGTRGQLEVRYTAFHDASQATERAAYMIFTPYSVPVLVDERALRGVLSKFRDDLTGDVVDGIVADGSVSDANLGLTEPAFELEVEDVDGVYHLLIGAKSSETHHYAALAGQSTVYRIGVSRVAVLDRLRPFDLVVRAVEEIDYDLVQGMLFVAGEVSYRVIIDRDADSSTPLYRFEGTPLSAVEVAELIELLNNLKMDGDLPGDARPAGTRPVLKITWMLNKPDLPERSVEFLPYDGEFHAMRRGGLDSASWFLVDQRSVEELVEMVEALSKSVPAG